MWHERAKARTMVNFATAKKNELARTGSACIFFCAEVIHHKNICQSCVVIVNAAGRSVNKNQSLQGVLNILTNAHTYYA